MRELTMEERVPRAIVQFAILMFLIGFVVGAVVALWAVIWR